MNSKTLLLTMALIFSGTANGTEGPNSSHSHKPVHGGIVAPGKVFDLELVAKPDLVQIFVSDHGKSIDVSGGTGKLTLLFGTEKREIELVPTGTRMEASGKFSLPAGTKAIAQIQLKGKPVATARFSIK